MNITEVRNNLHQLIESIDNDTVLSRFYDLLNAANNTEGSLWAKLSSAEKEELLMANAESDDLANLIPHEQVKAKYQKWL